MFQLVGYAKVKIRISKPVLTDLESAFFSCRYPPSQAQASLFYSLSPSYAHIKPTVPHFERVGFWVNFDVALFGVCLLLLFLHSLD